MDAHRPSPPHARSRCDNRGPFRDEYLVSRDVDIATAPIAAGGANLRGIE